MNYRNRIEGQGEVRRPNIYWHKNRGEWMRSSRKILTKITPETERWGWLLDVNEDLKYDVYLITKDSTCADVTYNKTEAVEIVKRFQQLREITMDLKRVLECNILRWLRGKGGDEIERETIERKSVDVIEEVFDPLLKFLEQTGKRNGRE